MREGWAKEIQCGDGWVASGAAVDGDQPDLIFVVLVAVVFGHR